VINEQHETQSQKINCFRCTNGCFHVVCYNITLTLNHLDFLVLAESMNALRLELKEKVHEAAGANQTHADALVM
jgi:hypothetical protein